MKRPKSNVLLRHVSAKKTIGENHQEKPSLNISKRNDDKIQPLEKV